MRGFMHAGRHLAYLKYVLTHKFYVALAGWRRFQVLSVQSWVELGLCLMHDNNKFHPAMWNPYAKYFYKPDGTRNTSLDEHGYTKYPPQTEAFRKAWLWHIKRSKHHPQYWVDVIYTPCGHDSHATLLHDDNTATCTVCWAKTNTLNQGAKSIHDRDAYRGWNYTLLVLNPMPKIYVTEMLCDWIGAGRAQRVGSNTRDWYLKVGYKLPFHATTRALVEKRLGVN